MVSFPNRKGQILFGDFHKGSTRCCVVLCHGFMSHRRLGVINNLYEDLVYNDVTVFRFDFSGNGESEGDFSDSLYSWQPKDLRDALNFLQREYGIDSFVTVGHSMGGSAVLIEAASDPRVKGVVLLAGVTKPYEVLKRLKDRFVVGKEFTPVPVKGVVFPDRKYVLSQKFIDDAQEVRVEIPDCPILCIHSERDDRVPFEYSLELADKGARLVRVDSDHLLLNVRDVILREVLSFIKTVC